MRALPVHRLYYGWVMVWSALAINVAVSPLNAVIFSFLIGPMSEDLGVPKSALAWSLTLRLFAAGLSGPMLGIMIDRHGARWVGAICGAIGGIGLIALGTVHSLWLAYAVFAVSGLAGFGGPAGQLLTQVPLAKWFIRQRGRALAIASTGMAAGTVFTIPITQWMIGIMGWRNTTMIFGAVVAAVVVSVSVLFVRRSPEDIGLHPDGDATPIDPSAVVDTTSRSARLITSIDWTAREALRTGTMWLALAALAIAGAALTGTLVYRVGFWTSTGMSPTLVGLGTALDPLTVVGSIMVVGLFADRFPIRYVGCAGLIGFAASIVPMIISNGEPWTIVAHNVLWGSAAGAYTALNNLFFPNYFGRRHLGAIRGIVMPVSIVASGLGAPLFGYLLDAGFAASTVWEISFSFFAVAAALIFVSKPPRPLAHHLTPALVPAAAAAD